MSETSRFGRYEVKRVLGEGQMGVVYLAKDPLIGRPVAIKAIREDPGNLSGGFAECRARFEREIQIAGTFAHPNIVTIYDVGLEKGQSFVAMECVEGGSLADLLGREHTLPFHKVTDLVEQIASALDYAHARGVVHRDVKPPNILLTFDGRPKVTDFGVARLADSTLTRHGATYGSPAYMSPEQAASQAISGSSDQFSLAILTYRMLTGELPFAGESINAVMYRIVREEPVPPGLLNPLLPQEASAALLRALSKNPLDRYGSCSELAAALREALESAAVAEKAASLPDTLAAEVFGPASAGAQSEGMPCGDSRPASAGDAGEKRGYLATLTSGLSVSLASTISRRTESRGWELLTVAVLGVLAVLVGANLIRSDSGPGNRPPREQVLTVLQKNASDGQVAMEDALLDLPTVGQSSSDKHVDSSGEGRGAVAGEDGLATSGDSERDTSGEEHPAADGSGGKWVDEDARSNSTSEEPEEPGATADGNRPGAGLSAEWSLIPGGSIPHNLARRSYRAAAAFRSIMSNPEEGIPVELLKDSACVAVVPGVVKVGFLFGGRSGKGLLSCQTEKGWSRPAFVSISGGSFGLQVGAQSSDFVLLFSDRGTVDRLAETPYRLGSAGTSVEAEPVGRGTEAIAREEIGPVVYSYSHSRGFFAGISLEGSSLALDDRSNTEVYGRSYAGPALLSSHGGGLQRELATFLEELGRYSRRTP